MLISGVWLECDDGIVRPVIKGQVLASHGAWIGTEFLVDTGADRTVLAATFLASLNLSQIPALDSLSGIGGVTGTVVVGTEIRFTIENGRKILFQGKFAGFTDAHASDMNILGRDILNQFAVLVDRPGDLVCMLATPHRYRIEP